MTPAEAYAKFTSNPDQDTLAHLPYFRKVAHGNILEIGVFEGASTSAFLLGVKENGGHVFSVDTNPDCAKVFAGDPDWTFIRADSREIISTLGRIPLMLDILFVDGDHSYEGCFSDLVGYGHLVRRGGLILVHDVCPPGQSGRDFPGVRRAFEDFMVETGWSFDIREGSCGLGVILAGVN